MRAPRDRRHIIVSQRKTERFTTHASGRAVHVPAPPSRQRHGQAMKASLESAVAEARRRQEKWQQQGGTIEGAAPGVYVQVESRPDLPLMLGQLESASKGGEVVAVIQGPSGVPQQGVERATVFVTEEGVAEINKRLARYVKDAPKKHRERRHEAMIDPVGGVRLAELRDLWTEATEPFPEPRAMVWWEVWLRGDEGRELARFATFAQTQGIELGHRRLRFDDRTVLLAKATGEQLAASLNALQDLAELRKVKETSAFFVGLEPRDQGEWAKDLEKRLRLPGTDAPSVCILDTGVNRGHLLLARALDVADCLTCNPAWGSDDHDGHGTEMAGLALLGDLTGILAGRESITLGHRLESVKILPAPGHPDTEAKLYGAVTLEATSRMEEQQPRRRRCFSMAVTSREGRDRGQPTAWSAAVDALASGRLFDPALGRGIVYDSDDLVKERRLFLISTGNVTSLEVDHLARSDTEVVEDPAQAWNAITVGAFTEKVDLRDPREGWSPVAARGDLSPFSMTSMTFMGEWPIKPELLVEGGNVLHDGKGSIDDCVPDFCVLTTSAKPSQHQFELCSMTSAATAQAARMAAIISAEYADLWPETIRALLVHSAEWTGPMRDYLGQAHNRKERVRRMRRYGFGVPSLDRALRSAKDALTLVTQQEMQPFEGSATNEMHLFDLPWPQEVLSHLAEARVRMRVTLSYFIEPKPGHRGWRDKHAYASHGLRFAVRRADESMEVFRKRVNKQALVHGESRPKGGGDTDGWFLGEQARSVGSIHSDFWEGTAADLAQRGAVVVYPSGGWWKESRKRGSEKTRYALVVSIESPEVEVDLWTPVALQVGLAVPTEA